VLRSGWLSEVARWSVLANAGLLESTRTRTGAVACCYGMVSLLEHWRVECRSFGRRGLVESTAQWAARVSREGAVGCGCGRVINLGRKWYGGRRTIKHYDSWLKLYPSIGYKCRNLAKP